MKLSDPNTCRGGVYNPECVQKRVIGEMSQIRNTLALGSANSIRGPILLHRLLL